MHSNVGLTLAGPPFLACLRWSAVVCGVQADRLLNVLNYIFNGVYVVNVFFIIDNNHAIATVVAVNNFAIGIQYYST